MSLQDDYFDLSAELKGHQKAKFDRIWQAFCDMEREHDKLEDIANTARKLVRLVSKEKN